MCTPMTEEVYAELQAQRARLEARERAAIANKCEQLKIVDEEAAKGGAIYEVLGRALPRLEPAAADTVRKLLRCEGVL